MRYAGIKYNDIVDTASGICVSFWAQGCPNHCQGCHNPQTWDFNGGMQKSEKEIIDEIRKYPNKSIDDILKDDAEIKTKEITNNNKVYKYKYLVGKYYLSSFCIIENIPKSNISFHCVFIQLKYDYDFNIIGINRYDDKKINYLFKENELTEHYLPYERAIFNKDYINDYYENCNYDNSHNYKVCLLCYTKKRFERVNLILK